MSDTNGAVDAAVADPKETAENAVDQAKSKVGNPTGIVKDIAEKTPAGKVVNGVTKSLDPVVSSIGSPKGQAGAPAARSEAARPGSKRFAPSIEAPASSQDFSKAAPEATFTLGRPGSIASSVTALIAQNGATSAQAGWTRPLDQASASAKPVEASSAAPAAPFAPLPPGDRPRRPPPSPAQPEPRSSLRSSARSSSWPRGQADWLGLDRT